MTKFNIPEIGTTVTLSEDWTFDLHQEGRNKSLFERLSLKYEPNLYMRGHPEKVTIPKDTVLKVDRIFIRKNMSDYSSITFFIIDSPDAKLKPINNNGKLTTFSVGKVVRFWAKLDECNEMEFV